MRLRLIPLFVSLLVCAFAVRAQTVSESGSTASIRGKIAVVDLIVESATDVRGISSNVQLLDPNGAGQFLVSNKYDLKRGRNSLKFELPIGDMRSSAENDIAWYRLQYKIGDSAGIISMSQLIGDLFELRISATDSLMAGMNYRVRVRAVNPFDDKPAVGVNVDINVELDLRGEGDKKLRLSGTGETGTDGFATVDILIPREAVLDDDGEIKVVGQRNGIVREAEEDLNAMSHDTQFLLMTDKPIFQPEQTVNIRGIVMKGGDERTIVADAELEFRILDEDDTVLFRERTRTSAFGVASAVWQIPSRARLGQYMIEVRDADGEQIGGRRIRISRYDLPNFAVSAKPNKKYYLPNDKTAEVEVRADYLFGRPVTKGKVRVVEETGREWNWKEQKYEINEGRVSEGETDATGAYTAKFDLKEDFEDFEDSDWRKYDDIKFAAYFTDPTTNRTEQRRFDIRVTKQPIHVFYFGDDYSVASGLPMNSYVSTFYADGKPAECEVELKASIEDEDSFRSVAKVRTNSYGVARLHMMRPNIGDPDDDLDFKITAKDKDGRTGTWSNDISFDADKAAVRLTTDRSIYKPGETMNISIVTTKKSGLVFLDVVRNWSVVDSRFAELKNGKTNIAVPYNDAFKGELKVAAYIEDEDDDVVSTGKGVIFPAREGISVTAEFDKTAYKPNDEATLKIGVTDVIGGAVQSALGVVMLDTAVEERARTDADFGGGVWRDFSGYLGYGASFAGVNIKDLNELDLTKPITAELQLVAEAMIYDSYYRPNTFYSPKYNAEAKSIFGESIKRQFAPVEKALNEAYKVDYSHPTDEASLRSMLAAASIDSKSLSDPWGMPYRAVFSVEKARDIVTFLSNGPDKIVDTADDFTAFTIGFEYFTPIGKAIDTAVNNYSAATGEVIRDKKSLFERLGVSQLIDRFGRPYHIVFEPNGRHILLNVRSSGADGKFESNSWSGDDFSVWTTKIDYFANIERKIFDIQRSLKTIPMTEAEFFTSLNAGGVDLGSFRDSYGKPVYVTVAESSRYWDKVTIESVQKYGETKRTDKTKTTPVTQKIITFTIRSSGLDGKVGTYDDFTFTQLVHVLAEQGKDDPAPIPVFRPIGHTVSTGSIGGTVTDANGAVISGATVTAKNDSTGVIRSVVTNADGAYLIAGLTAGSHAVTATATGFKNSRIADVPVRANETTPLNIVLEVGGASTVVTVTGDTASTQVDMADTSISTTVTRTTVELLPKGTSFSSLLKVAGKSATPVEKETPRIREYFPETLLWKPEVITDANGKSEIKFRMADSITTWKMYTIASTKSGKLGVAEKEVTAFQAFFVDLDPPKFLTEGDEIFLPTQVRNYTDKRQTVDVIMAKADWFSFLGAEKQQVDVEAGNSTNAVFGFKAAAVVKDGRQRVTAIAQTDSDAIEKPVTVRPNGQEIVKTDSKVFNANAAFDVNFPANALPKTQKADLKIYPNLYSHVAESVEGLLARPYGCGEQTISSTYPNLMIWKFAKPDSLIAKKAKRYLQRGYERLLGYQVADGGFTYWGGKDTSDIVLTAYALRFLNDAKSQIIVDEDVVKKAESWLIKQQRVDGSWTKRHYYETTEDAGRTKLTTTYVARSIAMRKDADKAALTKALDYLKTKNAEIDEPYALALYGLASLDAGNADTASVIAKQLEKFAINEDGGAYWKLETNTPFYGWGTAGHIETTALVLQLLIRESNGNPDAARKDLISKATLFLLKNKDRYGVWYSTQTTINVLDAFLAALGGESKTAKQSIDVLVNGKPLESIEVAPDRTEPVIIDLAGKLNTTDNRIEVRGSNDASLMSQVVALHYIDWKDADLSARTVNQSRALRLDYKCDKPNAAIMEEVSCVVEAERVGFQGYGMLLAEIGTPPGADISRESLEKAIETEGSISRYDILPDRIVIYMWSRAGGTKFNFKFRPRYGINAQTPSSIVYDYYNPEAQATVGPLKFSVK